MQSLTHPKRTGLNVYHKFQNVRLGQVGLLIVVGLFSFTYNLDVSLLEGTEGLYAQITREMVNSGEYFRLTFQGESYISKPPLYFWIIGGLTQIFGENEIALRLAGSLFSLGTMVLTFILGRTLFSWKVGFWSALIFATTHVFLYYGRRVLIDSTQTFFMTLALLSWVLGSHKKSSPIWFFVMFLAMALATMVKGFHGFAIPLLLILTYSILARDFEAFRKWEFWGGLIALILVIEASPSLFGSSFGAHFTWKNIVVHATDWANFGPTGRSLKIPAYLYLIWFDFFPWSVLIPSCMGFLFAMRPLRNRPGVLLILVWIVGYFLLLCLSQFRREPYLMPILPGLAVAIGYYLVALTSSIPIPRWHRFVNGTAFGILTIAAIVVSLFGPPLLHKKWNVPVDFLPTFYLLGLILLSTFLMWTAFQGHFGWMRKGLAGIGLWFVFGMVHIFLPAVDAASSPKIVNLQVREIAQRIQDPLFYYGITQEDLIFYLNSDPGIPRLHSYEQLLAQASNRKILIVTDGRDREELLNGKDLRVKVIEEFPQPRGRSFLLLSVGLSSRET